MEGTPVDQLPTFEQRQLELSTGGLVDDRKISRSESLPPAPVERSEGKPVRSLRAKSLVPNLGRQKEEFSSGMDELVTWCAPDARAPQLPPLYLPYISPISPL